MTHDAESASSTSPGVDVSAQAVFLAWERLRLIYNLVLASLVVVTAGPKLVDLAFLEFLILAGLAANVCFSTGPVAEGYLALLGEDRKTIRWILFTCGQLLACLLTLGSLVAWKMPTFH